MSKEKGFMNREVFVEKLREAIEKHAPKYGLAYAVLYGSYARGEWSPLSDVDLLVEFTDRRRDLYRLGLLAIDIEDTIGKTVDITQYCMAPISLRYKAFSEGITLYIGNRLIYVEDKRRAIMMWLDYSFIYNRLVKKYLEVNTNSRSRVNG